MADHKGALASPACEAALIEVKVSESEFSPHLFYFQRYFKKIPSYQIVYDLKRPKQADHIKMVEAHQFLSELKLL